MIRARELDELELLSRQQSATGVNELHPLLLFRMLDGAHAAKAAEDADTIARALSTWQGRARDVYLETLYQRLLEGMFDQQQQVCELIEAGERYIALCCGRRAGKTNLLAKLLVHFAMNAIEGQEVVFAGPTVVRAKELLWDELMRQVGRAGLDVVWSSSRHDGTVRTSHGVTIRFAGLDTEAAVNRFSRGGDCAAFIVDEAGVSWKMLKKLLTAADPAVRQRRGVFIMAGTPDQVESGDWYEICHGLSGFKPLNWSLLDNPFLGRDAQELLDEVRAANGWDENHPEYVTEWLGKWCTNPSMLVFELSEAKNLCDQPIQYNKRTWRHFVGIDYGFYPDPCAWVVLAAPPDRHELYCVHSEAHTEYDSDQISKKTLEIVTEYNPVAVVGDSASGGPVFFADYNRKYGRGRANIQAADKYDKCAGITLINTELRLGRFQFTAATKHLYDKVKVLRWEDEHRELVLEGAQYPEDEADAWRYAFLRALVLFVKEREAEENRHTRGIREANERALAAMAERMRYAGRR